MFSLVGFVACLGSLAAAAPALDRRQVPSVKIQDGTVVGSTSGGIDSFLGIPFAQPPVGELRLKPPQALNSSFGTLNATASPRACPQMYFEDNVASGDLLGAILDLQIFQNITNAGEDCLTINVQRPSTATAGSNLPVLFWIFGGGFELGSTSMYNGSTIINASMAQGKDVIYVSVNYRVAGFGFMPGKEILADGSANLGLLDQRLGLQWTADNIAAFGGDPDQVTIFGESAGAISVFDQMALYDGDNTYNGMPLFRAAIMDSGSIVPADPVDCSKGQAVYDTVVQNAGCATASDTLECLRGLDYEKFLSAANSVPGLLSYYSVALSYLPRPDGTALSDSPEILVQDGKYAKVPFIIGDQEDEGTLFAAFQSNLTSAEEVVDYLQTIFFFDATHDQLEELVSLYPDDIVSGSPFRTGLHNNYYAEFKHLAAILGDLVFTLTRRGFLSYAGQVNPDVPSWSYLSSYDYSESTLLGTSHGSDVAIFSGSMTGFPADTVLSYYVSFINTMDPNNGTEGYINWPQYSDGAQLINFLATNNTLIPDDFRQDAYNYILANVASFHI